MSAPLPEQATQPPDTGMSPTSHHYLVLSIYILTFLTGFPSNLLAFYTFFIKVRQKVVPIDILLLNLTVSDLILLLFLPFKMHEAASGMQWNLPQFLCPMTGFFYYSSIYTSTLFLTAVSMERYLGVAFPIKYKINRKPAYAMVASLIFWLLACSHCSVVYIVQYGVPMNRTESNASHCYESFSEEQKRILLPVRLEMCIVLFFIPFAITLFCYINFVRILMLLPNITAKRKQRAIGLAVATLVNFILCFAPYNISHIVGFITHKSPDWRVNALLPSTLNASLDPVIFYFSSTAVQRNFVECFGVILRKLQCGQPREKSCIPSCQATIEGSREERSNS
ncbi:free fatty acid receptor 2-like [Ambystoma mexicanum]|uniref:free fatty acid receptor 2-like n=1 Tax=Ambystoma mexicanum TaxID=8296 RepID=UPI0037E6FF2F